MGISTFIKQSLRTTLRKFGADYIRAVENTNYTWLGLRNRKFDHVIDVGANEGQFVKLALNYFKEAQFHCFEPLPDAFAKLQAFSQQTGEGRVFCHHLALGEMNGELEFVVHEDHSTSSSFLETTELTRDFCPSAARTVKSRVQVRTLDQVMAPETLRGKSVFLKCDVQGFEDRVLRGPKTTLPLVDAVMIDMNATY